MKRFFFNDSQRCGETVTLDSREAHHIQRVLRLPRGDRVILYDRRGASFVAEILETGSSVRLTIVAEAEKSSSRQRPLLVGAAGVRAKKMEMMLQKCTELGVHAFTPIESARCQHNLVRQYSGKNERWTRIIEEACKQCGRSRPMQLHELTSFADYTAVPAEDDALHLLFWEQEKRETLASAILDPCGDSPVYLLFGPEGGFTEGEVEAARALSWNSVGLGNRILRAETAVIAAVAIVQHALGQI